MKKDKKTTDAFFALLRSGLWETECRLSPFLPVDFSALLQLAQEQSVVGLIAAGLGHVVDVKPEKKDVLQFIGQTVQLEQRNAAMNYFIGVLVDKMRAVDIYTLLVKGQGVAQCYEKPLWRACGDVDFFLSAENYDKAKAFLTPLASSVEVESVSKKHFGMTIDPWVVELHGALRTGLSKRIDRVIDDTQHDVFYGGKVRTWMNDRTPVFLPSPDNDVIFIFTHFLKHFYKGGIGLRQICDWVRLLWTYRDEVDIRLLTERMRKMGLATEWKAFAAFAVSYLGMPPEAMPLFEDNGRWRRKGDRVCAFIMEVGNFGHNRDNSYYNKYPYLIQKIISLSVRIRDLFSHARIFPIDSLRFMPSIFFNGIRSAVNGE